MTANETGLAIFDQTDPEWQEIVGRIVDGLGKDDLPERVVEATELLLAGWPVYKAAKRIGVQTTTIRKWLQVYPAMALAVANGRKLLSQWRMSKLEQQFVQAVAKSEEILDLDLTDKDVNAKLVATVAQHSRYIIGLFAGQKIDVNVIVEEGSQTLKARNDALAYLAEELHRQRDTEQPVEAVYRVIDVDPEEGVQKPLLDQEGNSPHGQTGVLNKNTDGILCHICGKRFPQLTLHISTSHRMKVKEYELMYMLDLGAVRKMEEKTDGNSDSIGT